MVQLRVRDFFACVAKKPKSLFYQETSTASRGAIIDKSILWNRH